ncbi:MAG: hypothetical protein AAFP02_10550 [Bacteroidota bacterium]
MTEHTTPFKLFRPLAIILEAVFAGLAIFGLALGFNQLTILGLFCGAGMYMVGSFYLFKAERFKPADIALAVFSGVMMAIIMIGLLFDLLDWPQGAEMRAIGQLTLYPALALTGVIAIFRYLRGEGRTFEMRMSIKLFSRFLVLLLLYLVF